jgi:hypothetical protein
MVWQRTIASWLSFGPDALGGRGGASAEWRMVRRVCMRSYTLLPQHTTPAADLTCAGPLLMGSVADGVCAQEPVGPQEWLERVGGEAAVSVTEIGPFDCDFLVSRVSLPRE